jgi:multidrug efflux pump subunit AcrA (membrane-fusion protein)
VEAQIEQAQTQVAEAQRDLKDCWLYSSFRGQVAAVHVVPGSIVAQGEKVATVELMDPMKIELEVSASDSRRLKPRDTVRISTNGEGGQSNSQVAIIYMIDAVADPQTRTSTVTLLCRNRKTRTPVPPELASESIARTERIFPLNTDFVDENTNQILAEVRAIHRDDEGTYVWRIINRRFGEVSQGMSPLLEVEKVRVQCGEESISFLGNWNLVPITVVGDATLNQPGGAINEFAPSLGSQQPHNRDCRSLRFGLIRHLQFSCDAET